MLVDADDHAGGTAGMGHAHRAGRLLRAASAAAPALPVVVLSHEAGHLLGYLAFGFPSPRLHSDSASFATHDAFWALARSGRLVEAEAIHPAWQMGLAVAGGIAMTLLGILIALRALRAERPRAFWLAVAILAPLRFLVGVPAVHAWATGTPIQPGSDEGSLALLVGGHAGLPAALGLLVMVVTWVAVWRRLVRGPYDRRLVAAALAGMAIGGLLYARWIGPRLLG